MTFATKGFGATKPVAPNQKPDGSDDPEGRQKNRRVEIILSTS
jgi:photosystem I P700 chlorophyll a apoprotein A2